MPLSHEERELFLSEPHIGALSVEGDPGRAPLTVPVWYLYEPGADLRVLTGADSRKARLIRAAGRFSLLAERVRPTVRYVSVEGTVVESRAGTDDDLRQFATRYLPAEKVANYVEFASQDHGPTVLFRLRPDHWFSSDLGPL
ncbi:pyridoxamine 5'-phosphate oxidase family protein [Streptomyces sp. AJS327]|uniref:pyridoxamine 5'-phosphate oxidase family protein n=1 Tax=Streptomyces sp. AJS327 TaxID=2545265 RepID=UPI0015DE0B5C|nr:pyridoxamine 5'-phosphate oxidase family protein [Streptomyces sp. AJS327]MBA0053286.1 pyridoxamine 5'-phosphate oxidase family protein [Streptomyces sp. AJS327]